MQRILIVEDEQKQVVTCSRDWLRKAIRPISLIMRDGLGAASKGQYDLIIPRDAAFPRQVANHQRTEESGTKNGPVLTAKDNVRDKVKGLELLAQMTILLSPSILQSWLHG